MIWFLVGFMVGGCIGYLGCALMVIARDPQEGGF